MEQTFSWNSPTRLGTNGAASQASAAAETAAHPELAIYDSIRALLLSTGLSPDPETYELFWLYATGADAALVRELDRLLAEGPIARETVTALRRAHVGAIAAGEVQELVATARTETEQLEEGVRTGQRELAAFDSSVAEEDSALARGLSAPELTELVQRLRRANARMMSANRRLEAEMRKTLLRTGELIERLAEAEAAARTDPLTGLLNRRGTHDALRTAMEAANAADEPLSVSVVDIDHFKRLNDQWGHAIGDEVLRHVATVLRAQVARLAGEASFVGRIGGEEFLAVMPGAILPRACAAVDAARASLARQVLRRASDGMSLGRVSFSAGVASLRPEDTRETLIDRADAALYTAKRAGRDRVLPEAPAHNGAGPRPT